MTYGIFFDGYYVIFFDGYYVGMYSCDSKSQMVKERKRLKGLFPQFKIELVLQ